MNNRSILLLFEVRNSHLKTASVTVWVSCLGFGVFVYVFLSFDACVHFVAVCKFYVFNPVFICVRHSPSLIPRYGIFERCRELVEAGFDVRQPDKENVTLLHWAAINNRIDLVK